MIFYDAPQGSDSWLAARRGLITGSRFRDARGKLASGKPSKSCLDYSRDVARERVGGSVPSKFQNAAMRTGTEQEPLARLAYEEETGNVVTEVGFITDDEGIFGVSPDGLIADDGVLEVKTLVSSDTLFSVLADGDITCFIDQCLGYLWLLDRQWVDLVLWVPDLEPVGLHLTIKRITRNPEEIGKLENDLLTFLSMVNENELKLRNLIASTVKTA